MITTEAWVLKKLSNSSITKNLVLEKFSFPDIVDDEVLAEPLFGCWEANMTHAIARSPLDLCELRNEDQIVLGNAGVVRVTKVGKGLKDIAEGEIGIVFCNGVADESGYPKLILGYDAPGTVGVLAKKIKLQRKQIITIPKNSPASLPQWAAFSLRYVTAWSNWRAAYNCWRVQNEDCPPDNAYVAGWGGGVSFAQLALAKLQGFNSIMISSMDARLSCLEQIGIKAIDRRLFSKDKYEEIFLDTIFKYTNFKGINIFIDNIGANFQTTIKSLARQGVIATCGWRANMMFPIVRASECIHRHTHVFTHYAKYQEGLAAVDYATTHNWFPMIDDNARIYNWECIPKLIEDYANGLIKNYFPIFAVN
jgi:NADPH:quinone reductase-like Zn-dependent oxidoreductase